MAVYLISVAMAVEAWEHPGVRMAAEASMARDLLARGCLSIDEEVLWEEQTTFTEEGVLTYMSGRLTGSDA